MYQRKSEPKIKEKISVVVVPSGVHGSKLDNLEGTEETEIVAQIHVPSEGGWAWVVLVAAFINIFILDGVVFTFGTLLPDIAKSLAVQDSLIALINSIQVGFYFTASPLTSALINRFGFRTIGMIGAIICGFSALASCYSNDYVALLILYGCITGFGCSFICMTSSLIVGFYFEKLRSIALAIVSCGSSAGITVMYPINDVLVHIAGWKPVLLLFAGLYGSIYFFSLTFRPVVSITVTQLDDKGNPARSVTYLPSKTRMRQPNSGKGQSAQAISPTATPRTFVSNMYFPTAADVIQEGVATVQPQQMNAGTSTAPASPEARAPKLVISTQTKVSQRQLKLVKSMVSKGNVQDARRPSNIILDIPVERKKPKCCGHLCSWETDAPESRPMYKDDVFYDGKIENLPVYHKSTADIPEKDRTGLEYQMAVTRAVTVTDVNEKRGVFTTAVRRVLATMMDPKLLKRKSFILLCLSGFFTYAGVLVPYIFIQDRNLKAGMDPMHCAYFVSVLSFANFIGKLVLSSLSMKIDVVPIYYMALIVAGVSAIFSGISYTVVYQYLFVSVFGFGISAITCLRSVVIVALYGLESLTNATGVVVMFIGLGNLFSTPLAAAIKDSLGYDIAFYVSGFFVTLGGLCATPMRFFVKKEEAAAAADATVKKPII